MKQNTKNRVKGGLLALLMVAGVAKGVAEEKTGTVIMKRDTTRDSGRITTSVFIDTDGNRIPDTVLYIHGTNRVMFSMLLNEYIQKDSEILFDDTKVEESGGLLAIVTDYLISIDSMSVWDMFPEAKDTWFPYAVKYRRTR
jgi:hypothetical protein